MAKRLETINGRFTNYNSIYLTDKIEQYILHPDKSNEFSFSLGKKGNIFNDFPFLKALKHDDYTIVGDKIFIKHKVRLGISENSHTYYLLKSIDIRVALQELFSAQNNILLFSIFLVIFASILTLYFSRILLSRLDRVYKFSKNYLQNKKEMDIALFDIKGNDEIATLSSPLIKMVEDINYQENHAREQKEVAQKANKIKS